LSDVDVSYTKKRFLAAVLLTVIVVGSTTFLTTYLLSSSFSPSNTLTASAQVGSTFLAHLRNIESKNDSAVTREYADNATLTIRATTPDNISTAGTHSGVGTISEYWCAYILCDSDTAPFTIENVTYTMKATGRTAVVNATFYMNGSPICKFQSLVTVTASYVGSGSKWLISDESWNIRDVHGTLCAGSSSGRM